MEETFFVVTNSRWVAGPPTNSKRLRRQHLFALGRSVGHLQAGCRVLVKFRGLDGGLMSDADGRIAEYKGCYYLRSDELCDHLCGGVAEEYVACFFEGTTREARCVVQPCDGAWLDILSEENPTLRLESYGLPPIEATTITTARIVAALYRMFSTEDRELFAVHVSRFLDSPHILTPLFSHVLSLRSEHYLNFVIELKKVAEQIRWLLVEHGKSVRLESIEKSHVDTWSRMQGNEIAFLDGGVARISGVARLEPLALRVGIYAVTPGERSLEKREKWFMHPFVVGDCIDPEHPITEYTDRRRLLEAARFTFEPLTALQFLKKQHTTRFFLLHGPLVNQFAMYDEAEPHFIPALEPAFLERFGITEQSVTANLKDLPEDPKRGRPFWNHFMAIYAHIMRDVDRNHLPIAGVVERVAGRSVTKAVLAALLHDGVITKPYFKKIEEILERYDISDDFLFGCVLRAGEYVTPVLARKNLERRARDRWRPVVKQIPAPAATMVKAEDAAFPFRVEMNEAAAGQVEPLMKLIFHTARLLPRYAFPVGLDIADKYAKVPDWISRGISAEMSAAVIRRALRTGSPDVVAQVRQLLAKTPRDFFFRPGIDV